jgi:hypothetical protein
VQQRVKTRKWQEMGDVKSRQRQGRAKTKVAKQSMAAAFLVSMKIYLLPQYDQ